MPKFHILEMLDGVPTFQEVDGKAVEIAREVQGFRLSADPDCFYDLQTGGRLWTIYDEDREALERAQRLIKENGLLWWRGTQMAFSAKYGKPPEPEIEILQEPQSPGEITTCRMNTHCGHH